MQRIAPNTTPPRGNSGVRQSGNGGSGESPAFNMASRIRTEQGADRAAQYLRAMEPFLAPAERTHIAQQLGLNMPPPPSPVAQPAPPGASIPNGMPNIGDTPGISGMPGMGGTGLSNMFNMPNMGQMGNLGNIMQMVQLFQGMSGGGLGSMIGKGGGGMGSYPMQLAQILGSLMGGNKN